MERQRKYGNTPTTVDNLKFDSKAEAKRYWELKLELAAGVIANLRVHPHWDLHVNGHYVGYYEADFDYRRAGQVVVEDVKGKPTPLYRLKKKMLAAEYNIEIIEVRA